MSIQNPQASADEVQPRRAGEPRIPVAGFQSFIVGRGLAGLRSSLFGAASLVLAFRGSLPAATNLISADQIPPLQPPRGEIGPGFWEQYGSWVWLGIGLLLLVVCILIWRLTRPKPPPVIPPAGVQARQALEPLDAQPETGAVLSRVSQVVRHYFSLSFGLPPAERTTTEFSSALAASPQVSPELSAAVSDFLRKCDQRKFALAPPPMPLGAVATAVKLIEQAEAGRASPVQPPGPGHGG